jgi:LacI family transcriptional regulator
MSEIFSITLKLDSFIMARNVDAIKQLLIQNEKNIPEAYQCANDENAAVLCNALKSLGYRIPQDVALIGFDDSDVGTIMLPKLTTLHVQRDRMGREALYRLIWRINHHNSPVTETALPVDFIIRDSTFRKRDKTNEIE